MTNVERVIKAIEEEEFTITHYPCRASIKYMKLFLNLLRVMW